MNDRELLELAAKAAGEDVSWHETGSYFYRRSCNWPAEKGFFNPLHDDGEALRLAVKLRMSIEASVGHCAVAFDDQKGDVGLVEQDDGEEGLLPDSEIVRRAIVRAAAEIGKTMP